MATRGQYRPLEVVAEQLAGDFLRRDRQVGGYARRMDAAGGGTGNAQEIITGFDILETRFYSCICWT